jgi:flagellar motor switch protein FliG
MSDEGITDGAILLLSLGEEEAAEVLKYLSPREVQRVGEAMARLTNITKDRIEAVLTKFQEEAAQHSSIGLETDAFLRKTLSSALGDDKANLVLDRILKGDDTSGIDRLKFVDSITVSELIRNEHPQIIATILVHLENDQGSEILSHLPPRLRNDVVLRLATLDGIQPNALRELNESLQKLLQGSDQIKKKTLGGVRTAAQMLNLLPAAMESEAVESIREFDPELAQKIQDEMFKFEDLLELDDRSVQLVLREVQTEALIVALKGADAALREKIFKNMSQRAAEQLREDLETKGPVRLSEVESQQKEMLKVVRRLSEEGQIALGGKGEDQFI